MEALDSGSVRTAANLAALCTNPEYGKTSFQSCFGLSADVLIPSVLRLRATSQALATAVDGCLASLEVLDSDEIKLVLKEAIDFSSAGDDDDNDEDDEQEDQSDDGNGREWVRQVRRAREYNKVQLASLLRQPWWFIRPRLLIIMCGGDDHECSVLNDSVVAALMQRLDASQADSIELHIQGAGSGLLRPIFQCSKLQKLLLGGTWGSYMDSVAQVCVTSNLRHLAIGGLSELKYVTSMSSNTLLSLDIRGVNVNLEPQEIVRLLKAHAGSLETVKLELPNQRDELSSDNDEESDDIFFSRKNSKTFCCRTVVSTPMLALARLLRMTTLELHFSGNLELEALIPLVAKVTTFTLRYVGQWNTCSPPLKEMITRHGFPGPLRETAAHALALHEPFAVQVLSLRNVGTFRHEWEAILKKCSQLRSYTASIEGLYMRTSLDSIGIDYASHADVYALPESITHVYETRRSVYASAGPWNSSMKKEALQDATAEEIVLKFSKSSRNMHPEPCGILWCERSDREAPRCYGPMRPPQRLSLEDIRAELKTE